MVDAGMVASESADANDRDVDRRFVTQKRSALADGMLYCRSSWGGWECAKTTIPPNGSACFLQQRDLARVIQLVLYDTVQHEVEVVPVWFALLARNLFR